jgi:two-component system, cell cycle sensor histidine kinase and response regulator CckA
MKGAESWYRSLFKESLDGILLTTPTGAILAANPAICRLLGYSEAELCDRGRAGVVDLEDPRLADALVQRKKMGRVVTELTLLAKDGRRIPVEVSSGVFVDEDGREQTSMLVRDLSERKIAEERLRQSEERYTAVVNVMREGVIVRDMDGRVTAWNPSAERILQPIGCDVARPETFDWANRANHDDGSPVHQDQLPSLVALQTGEGRDDVSVRVRGLDNVTRWLSVNTRPLVRPGEVRPRGVVSTFTETTKARLAEAALRESESRFRSAMEYAAIGKALVDLDGRYLQVNRALCEIVGYTEEELLATTFQTLTHPDDLEADLESARRVLNGEIKTYQMEKRYIHRLGHTISVLHSVSLAHDDSGVPRYFISQIQDITERKALEVQLRQAQKMEAVGQLAGGVAHDFNNVLTAIALHVDLVRDGLPETSALRADLDEIRKGAARAARLTHQLLAFSRRQLLQPTSLKVSEVVDQLREMMRRLLGPEIVIRTEHDGARDIVVADRTQVEQVIVNLAINARDAMAQGGLLVLRTETVVLGAPMMRGNASVPAGTHVRLTVSDTGSGMDEATLARVFEPFFTTKPKGKGSGLGLATVHGIVHQSGGHIVIDSALGRGTRVEVYLPADTASERRRDDVAAQVGSGQAADSGDPAAREARRLVLVTDDEAAIRTVACRILDRAGYRTISAANGAEALDLARRHRPDLVLTDLVMPVMDGRALGEALRAEVSSMRVVYMSGYTQDAMFHRGILGDPAVPFIAKPFTAEQLVRAVARALASRDAAT